MAGSKNRKKYEPPVVREIGGIYEQATGTSACITGGAFTSLPCSIGQAAGGTGCGFGWGDQNCRTGASDGGGCTYGVGVGGSCAFGWFV